MLRGMRNIKYFFAFKRILALRLMNAIALYEHDPSTYTTEPLLTSSLPNKRIFIKFDYYS